FCSGCRNGGVLYLCPACGERAYCQTCLFIPENEADNFVCPPCFAVRQGEDGVLGKEKPYPFIFLRGMATRENHPKIIMTPLIIFSLHLRGWSILDTPCSVSYQALFPWLKGNVALVEIDFDLSSPEEIANFQGRMDNLLNQLKKPLFKRFTRFCVFITTHSDPITGYLHIGPNHCGSAPLEEVFEYLFPPKFQALLKCSSTNLLHIMACGSVVNISESNLALQAYAQKALFLRIYAYSHTDFQPSLCFNFVERHIVNFFIYGRYSLVPLLQDNQVLGSHTGIFEFCGSLPGQPNKLPALYRWSHPSKAPFGQRISPQCKFCKCVNTVKTVHVSDDSYTVVHRCKYISKKGKSCLFRAVYKMPTGGEWVLGRKPASFEQQGSWFKLKWVAVGANQKVGE
ncbi:hypothetical protein HYPSUDRAFT_137783, partial [Hypholoma sublateritium FD-334 SS-4]